MKPELCFIQLQLRSMKMRLLCPQGVAIRNRHRCPVGKRIYPIKSAGRSCPPVRRRSAVEKPATCKGFHAGPIWIDRYRASGPTVSCEGQEMNGNHRGRGEQLPDGMNGEAASFNLASRPV